MVNWNEGGSEDRSGWIWKGFARVILYLQEIENEYYSFPVSG